MSSTTSPAPSSTRHRLAARNMVDRPPSSALRLESWYSRLNARYVDLVGDFAGKERFFIEGDSLLFEVFQTSGLDFEVGLQILHAVYLVEQFLQNLFKRGCQFDIVFFHDHAGNCTPSGSLHASRYLLAHKIIRRHLRQNAPNLNVFRFQSTEDDMFREYLQSSSVLFAICADGTRYSADGRKMFNLQVHPPTAPNMSIDTLQSSRFRGIIYRLLHRGLDVALLNGMEFQDSKVFAFVVERSRKPFSQFIAKEVACLLTSSPLTSLPRHSGSTSQLADITTVIGSASARLRLTLATLKTMDSKFWTFFPACLAHALLLDSIPLTTRRFATVSFDGETESAITGFIDSWSNQLCQNIDSWTVKEEVDNSLVDIFDGRLFRQVVHHSVHSLPVAITSRLSPLLRMVTHAQSVPPTGHAYLRAASVDACEREGQQGEEDMMHSSSSSSSSSSIMPFSHPAFDKHLCEIHVIVDETSNGRLEGNKLSEELTHWHNSKKPILIKRNAPQDPMEKKKALRSNQRFMAEMVAYAASLTSTTGKSLTPELILVGASNGSSGKTLASRGSNMNDGTMDKTRSTQQQPSRQAPGKVKPTKFAAELAKRAEVANSATFGAWTRAREALDAAKSPEERYIQTMRYLASVIERKDVSVVINHVEMYKLSTLLEIWANYCRHSKKKEGLHVAALIYDILTSLSKSTVALPRDGAKILANVVARMSLGLDFKLGSLIDADRPLSFSFDYPHGLSLSIDDDWNTFRLAQTGPYMDRSMDSEQDDRVSFIPDGWQRKVLDALDALRSILVVAPTSSGKTFISFYAMEKVLRANDEDVVVYVAPTKALVNQVAAEVIARFNKNYKHPGTSIYAIHTRDYRVNVPTQCQVLITVPHILQIMLLSPANRKWVPKVKTIIFDEVHTINQADDGVVWEQLLLMAPCQIIALSATVGNTEEFSDWLSSTQSTFGRRFEVVEHKHRFSDLRKYVFNTRQLHAFAGLPRKPHLAPLGLEDVENFTYLHPVRSLRQGRIPTDLALESRDCLLLWQALKKSEISTCPLPQDLAPSEFFSVNSISKSDVIAWGERLKSELATRMKHSETVFKQVLDELEEDPVSAEATSQLKPSVGTNFSNTIDGPEPELGSQDVRGTSDTALVVHDDPEDSSISSLLTTTLPLLCKLRSSNALPAILFNYNRSSCGEIVRHVQQELVQAESEFKKNDPIWRAKVKAFDDWRERKAKSKAKETKKQKPATGDKADRERTSKRDAIRESAGSDDRNFDGFEPLAPIDAFSFADPKKSDRDELDKFVDYFRWRGIDERVIDAFQRGIGIHHAGMNRKYRQAVEICFRRGFLTVVVATGTLSLGINMPCKTVVFSGDSVFLTALNFRQASGRAGRRGFDLLGNVVFHEIGVEKAFRLLSSRLPDLTGHFPLTTSFILRLLGLLHGTNNAPYAMQMVNSLLSHPRLYLRGDSFRHQVLHHVRFSIEYLRSQGLVGAKGQPLNLSSCVSHLYFVEKGAFAFHALFREGVFHQLSEKMATNATDALQSLMLIMSHLFGRVPMRAVDKESEKELIKRSASVVFLPKMPQEVASVLNKHNKEILATYQLYVKTYVDQHCPQSDVKLPFTRVSIEPNSSGEAVSLTMNLPPTKLRSPFLALSGQGDQFHSLSDLCGSVRDGVFLEKAVIPYLDMGEELATPLNAYLYDFYQHGQVQSLETANRIRGGDIWFLLKDFSLVLATLVASLENFFKAGDNLDFDVTTIGAVSDEIELEIDASEEKQDSPSENSAKRSSTAPSSITDASTTMTRPPRKQTGGKGRVVESWEDSGLESSSDDNDRDASSETAQDRGNENDQLTGIRLQKVLSMFKRLQVEFDTKFKKIFA